MNVEDIPLPPYAYVPGLNSRHAENFLNHVKALATEITTDETAKNNTAWLYGIRLFENGFFWECHEVLETVWMNALPNSREKQFVQGIIHLANAALKIRMQRPAAAEKLSLLARQSFREAYMGRESCSLLLLNMKDLMQTIEKVKKQDITINLM